MTGADDPLVDEQADGVLDVARLVALVVEADEPVGTDLLVVDRVLLLLGLLPARVAEAACRELEHRVAVPGPAVGGRPEELGVAGAARRRAQPWLCTISGYGPSEPEVGAGGRIT